MTELELRNRVVRTMQDWIGAEEGDETHKHILEVYNSQTNLPRNYKMKETDAWCAATVSAALVANHLDRFMKMECSCYEFVELAKKDGIWIESDNFIPNIGDAILWDWQDSGIGDNVGHPDHIGMIEKVIVNENGTQFYSIEGNMSNKVSRRLVTANTKYIRGFICPKYKEAAAVFTREEMTTDERWAVDKGLFIGDEKGNYRFDEPITRGDLCTVLHRFWGV